MRAGSAREAGAQDDVAGEEHEGVVDVAAVGGLPPCERRDVEAADDLHAGDELARALEVREARAHAAHLRGCHAVEGHDNGGVLPEGHEPALVNADAQRLRDHHDHEVGEGVVVVLVALLDDREHGADDGVPGKEGLHDVLEAVLLCVVAFVAVLR